MIPILLLLAIGGLMQAAGTFAPSNGSLAGPELAFGFLLLMAYFTGKLVGRVGLPKLTGYILAGIVVGPYVLGLVDKDATRSLKMVGDVATAILALQAGSELDLKAVRPLLRTIKSMTVWAIFGTMIVLTAVLIAIRLTSNQLPFLNALDFLPAAAVAATMAVALTAQSPAVVMALIGETRADGVVTRTILAMVVIADLVVIIMFGIMSSMATAVVRGQADLGAAIGGIAWEVFGSIAFGLVIGVAIAQFLLHVRRGVGLFAVMLCFVSAELGHAVHLDPLVIMLTAGIYLQNFSRADAHALLGNFDAASLPVYLVFFALAGAKLNLVALSAVALPVAIVFVTRAASFYAGSKIACNRAGADPKVKQYAWIGLWPQAGLALALAELVRRTFPEFGDALFAMVVGVVACNEMIAPVILRIAFLRSGEAGKRVGHDFAADH